MSAGLSKDSAQPTPAIKLKAGAFTLPLLRLLGTDMDAVANELSAKAEQTPQFFRDTPVVIDLKSLSQPDASVEFPILVGLLRGYGMIPVGIWGGTKSQNAAARGMELAILPDALVRQRPTAQSAESKAPQQSASQTITKCVNRPVRSGQRIYAPGGDLVILSHVSSGGEVMADGNLHIYGSLRGRAMAGVKGNEQAHIFCQSFQPELVAVAKRYRISDQFDGDLIGKATHIYLKDRKLRMESFS